MGDLKFASRRSPIYSTKGIVSTSQPLASAAGIQILEQGGNAVDAAIAVAAVLAVTEPCSTGLGGDAFALVYKAETRAVTAVNGSGRSPAALTIDVVRESHPEATLRIPYGSAHAVTVPGAAAMWDDILAKHGTMTLAQVLQSAIQLARDGFPVSDITAHDWRAEEGKLQSQLNGSELLIDGCHAPRAGQVWSNPHLAAVLGELAAHGKQGVYSGWVADAIVTVVREAGGVLTLADLAAHETSLEVPIESEYRGVHVLECGPNSQGIVALMALNLLEGLDVQAMKAGSVAHLHAVIEALRLAFADARKYVADPMRVTVPVEDLVSKAYAAERRPLLYSHHALKHIASAGPGPASSDTVQFAIVDASGNAVSMVNSNFLGFGSGLVPRGCGFSLQNRGVGFVLEPGHLNALEPAKRPFHTIIPAMALYDDGSLYACFGVMGAFMQPQGHVQVILNLVDFEVGAQEALDRPRVCVEVTSEDFCEAESRVAVEEGFDEDVIEELRRRGHRVRVVRGFDRGYFGRGQVIVRDRTSGVLSAGSDPRADGCAIPLL